MSWLQKQDRDEMSSQCTLEHLWNPKSFLPVGRRWAQSFATSSLEALLAVRAGAGRCGRLCNEAAPGAGHSSPATGHQAGADASGAAGGGLPACRRLQQHTGGPQRVLQAGESRCSDARQIRQLYAAVSANSPCCRPTQRAGSAFAASAAPHCCVARLACCRCRASCA